MVASHPSHSADTSSDIAKELAERWLSAERFSPYLSDCKGDVALALKLYEWNTALSQVLMRDILNFEVALRNAYDREMCCYWGRGIHWLLDNGSPARIPVMRKSKQGELDVNRINRTIIDDAVSRLPKNASSGRLISSLTLGFWIHLSDRSREAVIWRTVLWRAWPRGTDRQKLQPRLLNILKMRNRVAHAERLIDPKDSAWSPLRADKDAVSLFKDLCPGISNWLGNDGNETPIEAFRREHPAPIAVRL